MFVKRLCIAPSICLPENYFLSASVSIPTHRRARGHMEPPPVSHCGPTAAEPDHTGTHPTCSPESTENTEGATDSQEGVPGGEEAIGMCRWTLLAPWGAVQDPKPG